MAFGSIVNLFSSGRNVTTNKSVSVYRSRCSLIKTGSADGATVIQSVIRRFQQGCLFQPMKRRRIYSLCTQTASSSEWLKAWSGASRNIFQVTLVETMAVMISLLLTLTNTCWIRLLKIFCSEQHSLDPTCQIRFSLRQLIHLFKNDLCFFFLHL